MRKEEVVEVNDRISTYCTNLGEVEGLNRMFNNITIIHNHQKFPSIDLLSRFFALSTTAFH